jgi:flagellar protein FliO/FliZ
MDTVDYLRFVFALIFVIALIGLVGFLGRRYGMGYRNVSRSGARRLSISEIMPLDQKRRLVLVKRDNQEHLLVLGGTTDLVIEKNISENDMAFAELLQDEKKTVKLKTPCAPTQEENISS